MNAKRSAVRFVGLGVLVSAAMLSAGAVSTAHAKNLGVGVMWRDNVDFGAQARFVGRLTGKFGFTTQIGYFFDPGDLDVDLDLHLPIGKEQDPNFYALAGVDFLTDFDNSDFGLNLGAGAVKTLSSSLVGFAELKYVFSDVDGAQLTLGLHF